MSVIQCRFRCCRGPSGSDWEVWVLTLVCTAWLLGTLLSPSFFICNLGMIRHRIFTQIKTYKALYMSCFLFYFVLLLFGFFPLGIKWKGWSSSYSLFLAHYLRWSVCFIVDLGLLVQIPFSPATPYSSYRKPSKYIIIYLFVCALQKCVLFYDH